MKTLVFLLLATATSASTYGTFGVAAHHPSGELGQVKWVEFGKQKEMKKFDYRLGTGGYTDKTSSPGAQSSLYGVAQLGLESRLRGGLYAGYFVGPLLLGNTDRFLGSVFQVGHSLSVGIADDRKVAIGITYRHISSGGISKRNIGRELIGLEVKF
jgi:hypothetical protein